MICCWLTVFSGKGVVFLSRAFCFCWTLLDTVSDCLPGLYSTQGEMTVVFQSSSYLVVSCWIMIETVEVNAIRRATYFDNYFLRSYSEKVDGICNSPKARLTAFYHLLLLGKVLNRCTFLMHTTFWLRPLKLWMPEFTQWYFKLEKQSLFFLLLLHEVRLPLSF